MKDINDMQEIFLSASVPVPNRGDYYKNSDPFLIQSAVRELIVQVIRSHIIVWGGHPAITPMILTICEDLDVDYNKSVVLYQSRFFSESFPKENMEFSNVVLTDIIENDRVKSLSHMREKMLSRKSLSAAVFIGGMEGIQEEYEIFTRLNPQADVLPVPSPGGASRELAIKLGVKTENELNDIAFSRLFYERFCAS
ncbi:hypothetical protein PEC302107_21210 [Pectobacterium araliae]|nr:hypothetical protein PEC302107_21210 [Pectobacterium carotovorum subsp. carotovorum]